MDKNHDVDNDDEVSVEVQGLGLVSDPLFENMATTVHSWLQECDIAHEQCQRSSEILRFPIAWSETRLPTRLLNVRVVGGRLRIRLCQPGKTAIKYAALSHCWGGTDFIKTTKDRYEEFHRDIPLSLFSPTLLQAAQITHDVGLTHLWCDSLCIVQDDPNDWAHEAPRMVRLPLNTFQIRPPLISFLYGFLRGTLCCSSTYYMLGRSLRQCVFHHCGLGIWFPGMLPSQVQPATTRKKASG